MSTTRGATVEGISRRRVWKWGIGAAAASIVVSPPDAAAISRVPAEYIALAGEPIALMVGAIERNKEGAILAAAVQWPDGTTGMYRADELDEQHHAVNSYHVTYGASHTYVQARVTRDSLGHVVDRPRMVVL